MFKCDICGLEFKTARSLATHRRPIRYIEALFEVAKRISSSLSAEKVLQSIVESTARVVSVKGCSFLLLSPDGKQLMHTATYGLSDWYVQKGPLSPEKSLPQAFVGKPVLVRNATEGKDVQYRWHNQKEGIASILAVPVILDNKIVGAMRVYSSKQRQFSEAEISFVEGVASLGALVLQKARLHEVVSHDLQQCNIELSCLQDERRNVFRFLSIATHDLKAPLAAVQTYFGVMLGSFAGEITERQRRILERCSVRIVELLELISDLLDISKIQAGQIVTEMTEVHLRKIVDSALGTAHNLAERKTIILETDIPRRLPQLYGASTRLQYVLTQLMSNAINYTDPGGTVKLKIINSRRAVQIEVSDTGIGVPVNELHQIFEEFYRASNSVGKSGTGLGLSIAKGVVEAHGGRIWAESPCVETGQGCRFTFTIPKRTKGSCSEVTMT